MDSAEIKTICNLLIDYLPEIKELIVAGVVLIGLGMIGSLATAIISLKSLTEIEDLASENAALKKLLFKIYFAHRITMKAKHNIDLDKAADEYQRKRLEILQQELDNYCEILLGNSPSNTDTEILKEEN